MLKAGRFPFATVRKRHAVQSCQAEVSAASIRVNANATARGPRACQANGRAGQQKLRRLRESRLRSSLPEDLQEYLGVDRAALSRVRRRGRGAASSCGAFVVSGARRRRPRLGLLQEREAPIVERKAGWADRLLSHDLNRKGGEIDVSRGSWGASAIVKRRSLDLPLRPPSASNSWKVSRICVFRHAEAPRSVPKVSIRSLSTSGGNGFGARATRASRTPGGAWRRPWPPRRPRPSCAADGRRCSMTR